MRSNRLTYAVLALAACGVAILASWKHLDRPTGSRLYAAPAIESKPAPQREWMPTKKLELGVVETAAIEVLPIIEPSKSALAAQPIPEAKSDLFLPPEPASINLNSQTPSAPPALANDDAPLVIVPPPDVPAPQLKKEVPMVAPIPEIILPALEPPTAPLKVETPPKVEPNLTPVKVEPQPKPIKAELLGEPRVIDNSKYNKFYEPLYWRDFDGDPKTIDKPNPTKTSQPGETTMKSIKIAMSALVGAALLSPPVMADPTTPLDRSVERLEEATKKLVDLEKALNEYRSSNSNAVKAIQNDLESLKSKIGQMETDIRDLRQLAVPLATTSKSIGSGDPAKSAQVKITNELINEMSVVVNGRSYRIQPGQTQTIPLAPGYFTFQVLNLQREIQGREIAPNEEKIIRIYDRNR